MKTRLLFVPVLLALVASLAACGGGGQTVPPNAVAVVNGKPITIAQFNEFFAQAVAQAKANGQNPSPGTQQYAQLRTGTVAGLVQLTAAEQEAAKEHVVVTPQEVTKAVNDVAKLYFGGSMKKLLAAFKKQGMDLKAVRDQKYINLLGTKLQAKVTASAKVTEQQEKAYYSSNIAQFQQAAATTRPVQYILFRCAPQGTYTCPASVSRAKKKLADKVERLLQNGASFAAMAKKYSDDPTTAPQGGTFTLTKGGVVPAFGTAGFALKTGKISQPVNATDTANQGYGWFIIKANGPAKSTKAHTQTFAQAKAQIQQALLSQQKQTLWGQWLADLQKQYKGKVSYQSSYAPPPTTALPTTTG